MDTAKISDIATKLQALAAEIYIFEIAIKASPQDNIALRKTIRSAAFALNMQAAKLALLSPGMAMPSPSQTRLALLPPLPPPAAKATKAATKEA